MCPAQAASCSGVSAEDVTLVDRRAGIEQGADPGHVAGARGGMHVAGPGRIWR
jgi:hypothetical protein